MITLSVVVAAFTISIVDWTDIVRKEERTTYVDSEEKKENGWRVEGFESVTGSRYVTYLVFSTKQVTPVDGLFFITTGQLNLSEFRLIVIRSCFTKIELKAKKIILKVM